MGLFGFGLSSAFGMAQVIHPLSRRHPNDAAYVALRKLLVEARKEAQLTQQELADLIGRQQSFVAKYEVGERYLDAVEFLVIASILNIDLREISTRVAGKSK